jgi:hypothetical protein
MEQATVMSTTPDGAFGSINHHQLPEEVIISYSKKGLNAS